MPAPKRGTRVYEAKVAFSFTSDDGYPVLVQPGDRYREGHAYLKGREDLFKLADEPKVNEADDEE